MTGRSRLGLSVLIASAFGFTLMDACRPAGVSPSESNAVKDSLRGIVSIVGTSFDKKTMLQMPGQSIELVSDSLVGRALTRVAGLRVLVVGSMASSRTINVINFVALRAGADSVIDGRLMRSGGGLALQNAQGIHILGNPPAAFAKMVGARIWVGGPLDKGPNTYGVIAP